MTYPILISIGLLAGICSGLFGIGGGVIMVPLMMLILGFVQTTANGTSLVALLLPVGVLGAWQYYQAGKITNEHIAYGLLLALGLFIGAYFGSKIAINMDETLLRKCFAVFLVCISLRLWFTA
ncbi:MAG: sulfite exporter TauE/SafE family protein [Alphaproteobacteria bacterium]|nr:MAG: sulfite exporter TauE/SafE family protein [Alphaproteobacteria bacterium]